LKHLLFSLKLEARNLVPPLLLTPPPPLKLPELPELWARALRIMLVWARALLIMLVWGLWVARELAQGLVRVSPKQAWGLMS
jgi:hypothetical protein